MVTFPDVLLVVIGTVYFELMMKSALDMKNAFYMRGPCFEIKQNYYRKWEYTYHVLLCILYPNFVAVEKKFKVMLLFLSFRIYAFEKREERAIGVSMV